MRSVLFSVTLLALVCLAPAVAQDAYIEGEIPEFFPDDVVLAEFMKPTSTMRKNDFLMSDFVAEGKSLEECRDWFVTEMPKHGWKAGQPAHMPKASILTFTKDGRRCGIHVKAFIGRPDGTLDESGCSVGIQTPVAGAQKKKAEPAAASSSAEATSSGAD